MCRHFFYLLTPPHFGGLNSESESSGSQPVYRKLFPRGTHSSKNNFFEIKISRPTSLDSLSVLLWLLTKVKVMAKSQHFKLNSRNISDTIKYNKYSEESNSSNSRADTGGRSPLNGPGTPLGPGGPQAPVSPFFPASPEGPCGPLGPTGP